MKKCIICKSIFPKEVETVWKYTCHRAKCESRLKIKRKNARNNKTKNNRSVDSRS